MRITYQIVPTYIPQLHPHTGSPKLHRTYSPPNLPHLPHLTHSPHPPRPIHTPHASPHTPTSLHPHTSPHAPTSSHTPTSPYTSTPLPLGLWLHLLYVRSCAGRDLQPAPWPRPVGRRGRLAPSPPPPLAALLSPSAYPSLPSPPIALLTCAPPR